DYVPRLRERRHHPSRVVASRVAAGVVEMQMRVDHERDVIRRYAELTQPVLQLRRTTRPRVLDAVDVVELVILLVPRAVVDQHEPRLVLDEQTPHAQLNE